MQELEAVTGPFACPDNESAAQVCCDLALKTRLTSSCRAQAGGAPESPGQHVTGQTAFANQRVHGTLEGNRTTYSVAAEHRTQASTGMQ